MTLTTSASSTFAQRGSETSACESELAAAAFLSRQRGRTLEAYRYDLRTFFQRATGVGVNVLDATRPHIELYRASLEDRRLAAATIDCRLSTVCGFFRFAHIDGRIAAEPGSVRATPERLPQRQRRHGPRSTRHVLVDC